MAENGRSAAESTSDTSPPGGGVGGVVLECLDDGAIFPLSKSSVDVAPDPLLQEELRKSHSSPSCSRAECRESAGTPLTDDYQSEGHGESSSPGVPECPRGAPEIPEMEDRRGERRTGQPEEPRTRQHRGGVPHRRSPSVAETLPPRHRAERPRSLAETAPSHRMGVASLGKGEAAGPSGSSSSQRDLREEELEPVPHRGTRRSLSAGLRAPGEPPGPHPRWGEMGAPCLGPWYCGRDAALVCRQPMQLLQTDTVAVCRSASGSPTQQLGGGVRLCLPSSPHGDEPCVPAQVGLEYPSAAYCHPLPIPTADQQLSQVPGTEGERPVPHLHPHPALLTFPRLMSSVSETGLDAKRMLGCCGPDCPEQGGAYPVPPWLGGGAWPGEAGLTRVTRETGTMTSRGELRDVGVQTARPEPQPPAHVFPEVTLATDEPQGGGGGSEVGPDVELGSGQKSPIKEVLWDAEGMTWEVYGASVDPEELGLAIQKHLELQIKEKAGRVAELTRQDTVSSQQSRRPRKRVFTMGPLRNPVCCARSSTALD